MIRIKWHNHRTATVHHVANLQLLVCNYVLTVAVPAMPSQVIDCIAVAT